MCIRDSLLQVFLNNINITVLCWKGKNMYLEIKDVKKSYGEDGSFVQVLNGITTEVEHGEMCVTVSYTHLLVNVLI